MRTPTMARSKKPPEIGLATEMRPLKKSRHSAVARVEPPATPVLEEDKSGALVSRISISLQPALLEELDRMVASSGYSSRSQAIGDMVNYQLVEHKRKLGNDVMVGTLTLIYDRLTTGLQKKLADLQYEHIDEVISSLHVALTHNQIMEVILLQGPAHLVQTIANEMIVQRGVITGHLQLMAAIIPPVHAASDSR